MKRPCASITAVVLTSALLAGCVGDRDDDGSNGPAAPQETAPERQAAPGQESPRQDANGNTRDERTPPDDPGASAALDATAIARAMQERLGSVTAVTEVTPENDPDGLLGTDGGYLSAAVLSERSVSCSNLGVDCGAVIEVFRSERDAEAREDELERTGRGREETTEERGVLLRVSPQVSDHVEDLYEDAFEAVVGD